MIQPDTFVIDDDMRAALEHDAAFLEQRNFDLLAADGQLALNDELSLYWSSEKPPVAFVKSEMIVVADRSIELRTFFPKGDMTDRYIVWVHGGGWNEGSLDGYERLMRILANSARCAVVGIGYTKAPVAQFPTQLNELYSAFQYISKVLFPDRPCRSVAGYSAGANLIVSTLTAYAEELGPDYFQRAGLACGVYDCDFGLPSYSRYDNTVLGSSKARLLDILETYAPGAISRRDPLVFPVHSHQGVCSDFLVVYAEHDLLRDDSIKLAESLRDQGKNVMARQISGVTHIFLQRSMRVSVAYQTIVDMGKYLSAA
ncbi:alpha/beta hydrolase [Pelagibius litoralis]|uniref:Alpha/beta hydrolase n=1 Tax=Pelagibius litoralis TaxID=374515 RepID=A0A967EXT1_9PROT|nr:alpha/beta hydrolase [Pelagibius litoralis]NIA69379.1 alpha/beta hydrolase [Pelagibius litoralis]